VENSKAYRQFAAIIKKNMGLVAKAKLLVRQFPFIFPKEIIYSCRDWIDSQKNKKGVYFKQRGPWYKTIFDEGFLHHPVPQTLGQPNEKAFYNNKDYPTDKSSLFYLQNCFLFGQKGLVLTADHRVFQEFSHHFSISSLKKFFRKKPFYIFSTGAKYVNGVGAVLVSPESHNYYHWLNDVLPRIKLYEQVLDKIDHFCIASNVPDKFLAVLPNFGIPENKILLVEEKEKLHFDYLYVSSLPGSEGRSPQWAVDYMREKLVKGPASKQPFKKIYFKRGVVSERKILNEDAIIKSLQAIGFEIIDPGTLSISGQVDLMQDAKLVISAHGAALSNLLFSRDNVAIIEIFSPDYFRTDCFYTLSSTRKLNYWYIVGDKPAGANWGDIVISEELLLKTIEGIDRG
jgi:capsular polysaccharide biosynthesis protein